MTGWKVLDKKFKSHPEPVPESMCYIQSGF